MAFTQVTVNMSFKFADGTRPVNGSVSFTPTGRMVNGADEVSEKPITAQITNGVGSVVLYANDDAGTTPQNLGYTVVEFLKGVGERTYSITVPSASSTVNLSDLSPASPLPLYSYATTGQLATKVDEADLSDPASPARVALGAAFGPRPVAPAQVPLADDQRITWLTQFASGHGWTATAAGTATVDANNTEKPALSSQAVKANSNGGNVTLQKSGLAWDLTDRSIILALDSEVADSASSVQVRVGDSTLSNYWTLVISGTERHPGYYNLVEIPIEAMTATGTPNRAAIATVQIVFLGATPATFYLGGVGSRTKSPAYPNGALMICFDDGYDDCFSVARPKLASLGWPGTSYVIADQIGQAGFMTLAQLQQMQDANGWAIGGHSYTLAAHTSTWANLTAAQVEDEARNLHDWMTTNGLRGWRHFAAPGGNFNSTVVSGALRYFSTLRGSGSVSAAQMLQARPTPLQPWRVASSSVDTTNYTNVAAIVQAAHDSGGLVSINFHRINGTGTNLSAAQFNSLMDSLAAIGIPVVTPLQLFEEVASQRDVSTFGALAQANTWTGDQKFSGAIKVVDPWLDVRARGAAGVDPTTDTAAIQQAITDVRNGGGGTVLIPKMFTTNSPLVLAGAGIEIRGISRENCGIINATTDLFQLGDASASFSQGSISKMRLRSSTGGGHIFTQGKNCSQVDFEHLDLYQYNDGKSVMDSNNLGLVETFWRNCFSQHTLTATVPTWNLYMNGGGINRNTWEGMRVLYSGNYVWHVEEKGANWCNDNVWRDINAEVTNGGVFRLLSPRGGVIENIGIYDLTTTTKDLILVSKSTGSNGYINLRGVHRLGGALGGGLVDLHVVNPALVYIDGYINATIDFDNSRSVAMGMDTCTLQNAGFIIEYSRYGPIFRSPDGTRYIITVANGGAVSTSVSPG